MKTIYARQVSPEHTNSDCYWDFDSYKNINFVGNRSYRDRTEDNFENADRAFSDVDYFCDCLQDIYKRRPDRTYKNATELFDGFFSNTYGKLNKRQVGRLKKCFENYEYRRESDHLDSIAELLSILTKNDWERSMINGSCQSDWRYIVYDTSIYNKEMIEWLEVMYFNTGDEWMLYEDAEFEEMWGGCYTTSYNTDEIKNEIKHAYGDFGSDVDVKLYKFTHYQQIPQYEEEK